MTGGDPTGGGGGKGLVDFPCFHLEPLMQCFSKWAKTPPCECWNGPGRRKKRAIGKLGMEVSGRKGDSSGSVEDKGDSSGSVEEKRTLVGQWKKKGTVVGQ